MIYLPRSDSYKMIIDAVESLKRDRNYKYYTYISSRGWYFFNNPEDIIYPLDTGGDIPSMVTSEVKITITRLLTSRLPRNYTPTQTSHQG